MVRNSNLTHKRNVLVFHRLKIMSPRHHVRQNKVGWIHVLKLRSSSQALEPTRSSLTAEDFGHTFFLLSVEHWPGSQGGENNR